MDMPATPLLRRPATPGPQTTKPRGAVIFGKNAFVALSNTFSFPVTVPTPRLLIEYHQQGERERRSSSAAAAAMDAAAAATSSNTMDTAATEPAPDTSHAAAAGDDGTHVASGAPHAVPALDSPLPLTMTFPTVEHFYHAAKHLRTNPQLALEIARANAVHRAFQLAMAHRIDTHWWLLVRDSVMRYALWLKFTGGLPTNPSPHAGAGATSRPHSQLASPAPPVTLTGAVDATESEGAPKSGSSTPPPPVGKSVNYVPGLDPHHDADGTRTPPGVTATATLSGPPPTGGHEDVRRELLATGDRELILHMPDDPYWGCCCCCCVGCSPP